jgi:transglutaminase-like putative cysteine protease
MNAVSQRALCALASIALAGAAAATPAPRYQLHHEATIRDIPAGAKKARVWLVVPRDDPAQRIGEIKLTGPGHGVVHRGGSYHNRYAYFEVENPPARFTVAADFTLERRVAHVDLNPSSVQLLAAPDRARFQRELAANTYVPVSEKYRTLARQIVGEETNPVAQAHRLFDWVLNNVEYWVKDPQHLKASANGESDYCLVTKTGNCSDFHSLYTSLARSIGIPTRMVYGSLLQGENTPVPNKASLDGKDVDGSYHCWVEFYAEGIGWAPLDVALADLLPTPDRQQWYFGNLDDHRVAWSIGRDLTLAPKQDAGPVNAMQKVYVEVDSQPHTAWDRKFTYSSLAP